MDEREPAGSPRRGGEGCGSRKLLVLKASESTACGVRGQTERGTAPAPGRAPAHPSSRGLCPGISLLAPSWARAGDLLPLSAFGGPRLLLSPLEPAGMVAGRGWGRPLTCCGRTHEQGPRPSLRCSVPAVNDYRAPNPLAAGTFPAHVHREPEEQVPRMPSPPVPGPQRHCCAGQLVRPRGPVSPCP